MYNFRQMLTRILAAVFVAFIFLSRPAGALDGGRVGDCWTDYDGTNHCGESSGGAYQRSTTYDDSYTSSASSDSGYGWTYTYGYTNSASRVSAAASWAERVEAARERREMEAEAQRQREAVRLNDIGNDFFKKEDFAHAIDYYQKALSIRPADGQITANLRKAKGSLLNLEGNEYYDASYFEKAVESYEEALAFKPDSQVIRENLEQARNLLANQKSWETARERGRAEIAAAKERIVDRLEEFSKKFAAPAVGGSGLSFKGSDGAVVSGSSSGLQFKEAGPSPTTLSDTSVVDLRDAKTDVVDPSRVRGGLPTSPSQTASAKTLTTHEPPPPDPDVIFFTESMIPPAVSTAASPLSDMDENIALFTDELLFPKPSFFEPTDSDAPFFLESINVPPPAATPDMVDLAIGSNTEKKRSG